MRTTQLFANSAMTVEQDALATERESQKPGQLRNCMMSTIIVVTAVDKQIDTKNRF